MAILTASTQRRQRNKPNTYATYPMAASITIFEGAMVSVTDATGLALNSTDTAATSFVGICTKTVTSAATGTTIVEVEYGHEELMGTNVTTVALMNVPVVVADNDLVTTVAAGANDVVVGSLVENVSATQAWIRIRVPVL